MKLPEAIARTAETKVGIRESGGPNKGKALAEFFAADWYKPNATDDGYAWCAAFVCRIVQIAMEATGVMETATFKRPRTPGAWDFENWCRSVDGTAVLKKPPGKDISRGDIVILKISHIAIAVSAPDKFGYFQTVEGNTNKAGSREGDGVYQKTRHVAEIRSRIRFFV